MCTIKFPQFRKAREGLKMHPGLTILEFARMSGIRINAECSGIGKCGKCIVRIAQGEENLNPPTKTEKTFRLKAGERLACQTRIVRDRVDTVVYIKNFGEYEILKYGIERQVPLSPAYVRQDAAVLRGDVRADRYRGKIYGLAVDIGTTTVVTDLVDIENGDVLETVARSNPQISYGNDVISRIEYTLVDKDNGGYVRQPEKNSRLDILRRMLVDQLNETITELSDGIGDDISQYIYHVVVVGNSTMRNLFFGLDVSSLGIMPYEAPLPGPVNAEPAKAGLSVNSRGSVYGCPLIGGHVGADIVADILASGMYLDDRLSLLIDIGTNGEVVLGNRDRLIAASCAAGGAFEGASVSCGVGGIQGAIKKLQIVNGRIVYSTIGDKYPIGLCGSGLIDLLAELLDKGIMSRNARIENTFSITGDLELTQNDIFQLITSKAAIKTGWEILLKHYGADIMDVEKIFLSGGFGNFIDVKNAMKIGLIPDVPEERVIRIGNGAIEGAREMLLCRDSMAAAEKIAESTCHIKTNEIEKDFEYMMAGNMYF